MIISYQQILTKNIRRALGTLGKFEEQFASVMDSL